MNRSIALALSAFVSIAAFAQSQDQPKALDPVKWAITAKQVDAHQWDIAFKATINDGWHVYSQEHFGDEGPMPTAFQFDTVPSFTASGKPAETGKSTHEGIDPVFEMKVKSFNGWALFTQRVTTDSPDKPSLGALISWPAMTRPAFFLIPSTSPSRPPRVRHPWRAFPSRRPVPTLRQRSSIR